MLKQFLVQFTGYDIKVNSAMPKGTYVWAAHLPVFGRLARRWINHGVCDAWPVRATPDLRLPSQLTLTKFSKYILLGDS